MHFVKVAAHGLIKKDNKYLIIQRSANDDYMPGFWDIPGGTIGFGEKIEDALIREITEETGLNIATGKILFCFGYISETIPDRHQFTLVYACDYIGGEIKLDPQEHQDFKWVTLEEMKNLPKIAFLEELFKYLQP